LAGTAARHRPTNDADARLLLAFVAFFNPTQSAAAIASLDITVVASLDLVPDDAVATHGHLTQRQLHLDQAMKLHHSVDLTGGHACLSSQSIDSQGERAFGEPLVHERHQ
jgi:hypothetical protein